MNNNFKQLLQFLSEDENISIKIYFKDGEWVIEYYYINELKTKAFYRDFDMSVTAINNYLLDET